jgi:hypothetical protein
MPFERGEVVEWTIQDRQHLILKRKRVPRSPARGKKRASR